MDVLAERVGPHGDDRARVVVPEHAEQLRQLGGEQLVLKGGRGGGSLLRELCPSGSMEGILRASTTHLTTRSGMSRVVTHEAEAAVQGDLLCHAIDRLVLQRHRGTGRGASP